MIGRRMLKDLAMLRDHGPKAASWWLVAELRRLQDHGLVTVGPSENYYGGEVTITEKGRQELARRGR